MDRRVDRRCIISSQKKAFKTQFKKDNNSKNYVILTLILCGLAIVNSYIHTVHCYFVILDNIS